MVALSSGVTSQKGGRATEVVPPSRITDTIANPFFWTTALTKCVVPRLNHPTSEAFSTTLARMRLTPSVTSPEVVSSFAHLRIFPESEMATASVLVPPTPMPMWYVMLDKFGLVRGYDLNTQNRVSVSRSHSKTCFTLGDFFLVNNLRVVPQVLFASGVPSVKRGNEDGSVFPYPMAPGSFPLPHPFSRP
jgi:hypothetical protein